MVKVVAVLGNSEGVKGTIYFVQEGDGEKSLEILLSNHRHRIHHWPQAWASWLPWPHFNPEILLERNMVLLKMKTDMLVI
ncbi:hypothetical protein ZIOFF_000929 [Zingiber officinale]|uniref:Uncharacterized protein n=1 Tax=Zingiber officinale TaxID=94328 RepID=A0A8J5IKV7_ZINOF|nr:hypothetical protein ZIOFF_000929 [Zingiber officinale]